MKNLIFIAVLLCSFTSAALAQKNSYQAAMTANVQKLDTAEAQSTYVVLTNNFERIALKEKSNWLPYYYAAYSKLNEAYEEKNKEKIDPLCDKAELYLAKADSLSPNNPEIVCIKAMIATARIRVDFMERGMKYVTLSNVLLESAKSSAPTNPRIYYLLGRNTYGTPKAFGGSKERAYTLFEKAGGLFAEQLEKEKTIEPHWGRHDIEQMMLKYQGAGQKAEVETKSTDPTTNR